MSFQHPWFYKAKKRPKDKDCCMNVILLKLSSHHNRLTIRKEGIIITCLKNNKTYKFLSPIILLNCIRSLISSINFLHHYCLISKQNWLYINSLLHEGVKIATPFPSRYFLELWKIWPDWRSFFALKKMDVGGFLKMSLIKSWSVA